MTVFTMFYSHSYLLYSYSHPLNVKNSIPFSQFLRLRRLCSYESNFSDELEAMKDWEESIHLLLFATREAIQHSGIQSFDLVFRHTVRGPLKVL